VTEVGSEERIPLRRSNRSEGLRSEGCRVEEFGQGFVTKPSVLDLVRAILPSAVKRGGTIVVAVLFAIALNRVISTAAGFSDREGLAALPCRDGIHLPPGEGKLLGASEGLSKLQFVVQ